MATVFEPIRPVPPMTTIFMVYPSLVDDSNCNPAAKSSLRFGVALVVSKQRRDIHPIPRRCARVLCLFLILISNSVATARTKRGRLAQFVDSRLAGADDLRSEDDNSHQLLASGQYVRPRML